MVHEVQETVEVESIDEEIAENQHVRIEVTSASDSDSLHLPEGDDDSEPEVPSGPRPKRLSDLNLKEKTIPMPNASSLFFLGTNNAFRKAAHKIGTRFVIFHPTTGFWLSKTTALVDNWINEKRRYSEFKCLHKYYPCLYCILLYHTSHWRSYWWA